MDSPNPSGKTQGFGQLWPHIHITGPDPPLDSVNKLKFGPNPPLDSANLAQFGPILPSDSGNSAQIVPTLPNLAQFHPRIVAT